MLHKLDKIIDVKKLQCLTDALYSATAIPVSIISTGGRILTGSGWQRICTDFHRKHPEAEKKCIKSDIRIRKDLLGGKKQTVYKCPHGLMDAVAPIVVNNIHIGNLFTGQFLTRSPGPGEIKFFREQAGRYEFDEKQYLDALSEVPVISEDRVNEILAFLKQFAQMIAGMGYNHFKQGEDAAALQRANKNLELEIQKRKHVEEELRENLKFQQNLIDAIPQPIFFKDVDGVYQGCNAAFADTILGLPKDKIVGRSLFELSDEIPEDLAAQYHKRDMELAAQGGHQFYEADVKCADGSRRRFRFNKAILRAKDTGQGGIVGAMQDVTEVRKAESVLQSQTEKLNQILQGNSIAAFVINADHIVTHWNRACERLTGLSARDMIGSDRHWEAFYEEKRPVMADLIVSNASIETGSRYYGKHFRASELVSGGYEGEGFYPDIGENGKWLFFTAAPLKNIDGAITGSIETLQDITARRIAEQNLRASEQHYRLLFESANDAIFLMKDNIITDCNSKALETFSCTPQQIVGMSPLDISPENQPDGRASRDLIKNGSQVVLNGKPMFFEWEFKRPDKTGFIAEVSLNRLKILEKPHVLSIVRDISHRKQMIETLQKREKELDEKTRYLEKVNQALKSTLDQREIEKRAIEENMFIKLKRFVFPYLEELGRCRIGTEASAYLNIIETNLSDLVSPLSARLFSKYIDLTPTEIRVADLIREGKNTKEIAQMMALSPSSIQWHRKNIRTKLGLRNKKINLTTYLSSLEDR